MPAFTQAPPSDAELIARSAAGERIAFDKLVERHRAAVFRFAQTLCAGNTEDVLQECFISAWRGAGSFRGDGSARSWLFTIARNACYRMLRRRSGEPAKFEALDTLGCEAGWGSDSSQLRRRLEDRDQLQKAFAQLSPSDREPLLLVDVEGMSAAEAARVLDLSVAALKSRLHRARLRLLATLRNDEAPVNDAG